MNNEDSRFRGSCKTVVNILSKTYEGIKFCHINAQSLLKKMDEFLSIFETSKIDIICISESWFLPSTQDSLVSIPGFKLFRADRDSHAGGVAIYVRLGIPTRIVAKSSSTNLCEFLFLEVRNDSNKLLLGCCYRPNRFTSLCDITDLLESLAVEYADIVVVGDFNCNILADSSLTNEMRTFGLFPTNVSAPTHFSSSCSTLLDIYFVSDLSKVIRYDQVSAPQFSKHDCIFLAYDFNLSPKRTTTNTFRDYRIIDYHGLQSAITNIDWDIIRYIVSINDQFNYFNECILSLFNQWVPVKTVREAQNSNKPWFNNRIASLIQSRDEVYAHWKRFRTPELLNQLKKLKSAVKKELKASKSKYFENKFKNA